jgi:hypothetical protein
MLKKVISIFKFILFAPLRVTAQIHKSLGQSCKIPRIQKNHTNPVFKTNSTNWI